MMSMKPATPAEAEELAKKAVGDCLTACRIASRDNVAMWGNLLTAHAWGVACYVRPGWFPAAVSLVSILMAALILYEDKITAAIAARADDEQPNTQ